jgi:hypothetical protein
MPFAVRATLASFLVFGCVFDAHVAAADRPAIAAVNVGMQAGLTLARGVIQRKVRSRRQVLRSLFWGGASGAGFYGAKELVASDRFAPGWIVANMAMSVSENAALGLHPLAQVGYSVGPVRFRVPLPRFQKGADARVYVDVSAYETGAFFWAIAAHDRMRLKGGMLAFERDTPYRESRTAADFTVRAFVGGRTTGMFPGVWTGARELGFLDDVWRHEAVHAVQSLQLDAAEPSFGFLTNEREATANGTRHFVRFEHLKLGLVNVADDAIESASQKPWRETEAYRLANGTEF